MKKISGISSVESKADFRQELVEKFVQQNLPPKRLTQNKFSGMGRFSETYREIECCAAETPAMGTVEIFYTPKFYSTIRRISVPVNSRFFVFFSRDETDEYRVTCSSSLS